MRRSWCAASNTTRPNRQNNIFSSQNVRAQNRFSKPDVHTTSKFFRWHCTCAAGRSPAERKFGHKRCDGVCAAGRLATRPVGRSCPRRIKTFGDLICLIAGRVHGLKVGGGVLGLFVLGRIFSYAVDGPPANPHAEIMWALEFIGTVSAFALWWYEASGWARRRQTIWAHGSSSPSHRVSRSPRPARSWTAGAGRLRGSFGTKTRVTPHRSQCCGPHTSPL